MKKILLLSIFIIAGFYAVSAQAAGLGEACTTNSECSTGNCATKHQASDGVCMPSSITSDTTISIHRVDSGWTTDGHVQYRSSSGQSLFNNFMPGLSWDTWTGWVSFFCDQLVYGAEDGNTKYWKATDGTKYWYADRSLDGVDGPILNALSEVICKTAVQKKSNGSSCGSASECLSGYCVHSYCRSSSIYCGDSYCDYGENCSSCSADCGSCGPVCGNGSCESGESCSSCRSDCGECKKSNGSSCYSNSECSSNYCVHMVCRASSVYCGDAHCDSGESCSSCSSDCGSCAPTLKSDGESCETSHECEHACVHNVCRPHYPYCGDEYCEGGETCSSCSSDCGACQEKEVVKKADGEYCDKSEECTSGNCQNYRCCLKNKTCCLSYNNCSSEQYCSEEKHYCIPRLPDGQSCSEDSFCKSGNCKNYICCDWGQTCCQKQADCDVKDYCQTATYYCRDKWSLGSGCGDYGSAMCLSGYCDPDTRQCAEKPAGAEEPLAAPKEATVPEEMVVISLSDASLQKAETRKPAITIQNKSLKEVILGEYVLVENPIPSAVDTKISALRIFKKKLLPGETISTKSEDGQMETIEEISLTGLKQGSGAIKLKLVYFVDNQAKWAQGQLPISVSDVHLEKEEMASQVFNETMLLEEKREVTDATSDAKKEYVFVSVEDKSLQQAAINDWQVSRQEMEKAVTNLKDDFTGTVKPEIVSFFETIKSLEEAKSSQEIAEASIRAVAPPAIIASFDFANLLDAIDKQKKLERGLLTHFDATDFVKVPTYDNQRNITGYTKAIVKEKDGQFYAVKIGDL